MSQRPQSRNACTRERPMSRTKSSESNRCERPQENNCRIEPIQEECADNIEDQSCPDMDQEPRYDAKEIRDAVRILNPFVRLIKDTRNPYARIVAREVCKTFYRLFHPNKHPIDVMKTINWRAKTIRTNQLWNEFWLYVPGSIIEDWVPLRNNCTKDDNLMDFSDYCDPCPPQNNQKQCPVNQLPDNENCNDQPYSNRRRQSQRTQRSRRNSTECVNFEDMCGSDTYQNLHDISPPEDMMFEHQCAGSDNLPNTNDSKSKVQRRISTNFQSNDNQNKHLFKFDSKHSEKIFGTQCQHGQLEATSIKSCIGFEETTRRNKMKNCSPECDFSIRQLAGDDVYIPNCQPGCSSDPTYTINPGVNSSQYEYYRVTANTQSPPQRNQNNIFQPVPKSPVEPELRTNALQCSIADNDDECNDSDSVESVQSIQQIVCKSNLVANAFTNLSLAKKDLQTKTDAFNLLTQHYLNFSSNPIELDPPCTDSPSAKMILQAIYKNPPKIIKPFSDCEWNDNAFKDKDFISLLPFYESVHNQLEYISKTQRDYGINMLDDIMSTLYHIHYDLGDPRLKNDMLLEHVKLITRNTWESYFYKDKKMPAIPEKSQEYYPPSSQNTPQKSSSRPCSPRQPSPRQPSPVQQSCPKQDCPKPPNQRPSNIKEKVPLKPKPNVCRRTETTCNQTVVDDPQQACQPPAQNKSNYKTIYSHNHLI